MFGQGDSSIYRSSAEVPKYVHKTTRRFWACYQKLPRAIQKLADTQFERLKEDPTQQPVSHHFEIEDITDYLERKYWFVDRFGI